MSGNSNVDGENLTGLSRYFNTTTINGRFNVSMKKLY